MPSILVPHAVLCTKKILKDILPRLFFSMTLWEAPIRSKQLAEQAASCYMKVKVSNVDM